MKKLLFLFLPFSFLVFSYFSVAGARPLNLESGAFHDSTEKKERPEVEKISKPPPPPEGIKIVVQNLPAVQLGDAWTGTITVGLVNKNSGASVPLTPGSHIFLEIWHTKDGGITWGQTESDHYIVDSVKKEAIINGEDFGKIGAEASKSSSDYCYPTIVVIRA